MAEELDELVVRVRADTSALKSELDAMKRELNGPFAQGLKTVGDHLERALVGAVRKGKLSFEDLKKAALAAMNQIAAASLRGIMPQINFGGADLTKLLPPILGLPGRAIGGPVSDNRPYIVGERGPELFVPTSAGRVETLAPSSGSVRVNIAVQAPQGEAEVQALSRTSRQMAAAVGRAMRAQR